MELYNSRMKPCGILHVCVARSTWKRFVRRLQVVRNAQGHT